ncbi:peptidase domain-containing ABC transporter [Sphingobacterium chungjuense]|uniref:peptidase domain-containing ABC transporter n=1 Tax=Sphingobacterium chungjuense TaxID=2675553 RepID=UPI00140D8E13|nr:peptidase domain-containing ABC transporter [Sphingobacterium chungjuense]
MISTFPHYKQMDQMDCGATCLRIIAKFYGKRISVRIARSVCQTNKKGVNLLGLSEGAEALGLKTRGLRLSILQLSEIQLPCIVHFNQNHFVVLYKITSNFYHISDPASSISKYTKAEFESKWLPSRTKNVGTVLLTEPTSNFFSAEYNDEKLAFNWGTIISYFRNYQNLIVKLFFGILLGSVFSLITPFLTQSIVDVGIQNSDISFINLILLAQLMLFAGGIAMSFMQSWITLHINSRVNISIVSDLLMKIMKLPINFFDLKTHGDIMQRIGDQNRLESFLTETATSTVFSMFNAFIFGFILLQYNRTIFLIFSIATVIYTIWIVFFLKFRRQLDERRFKVAADNQTYMVEIIQSIRDIKLNNAEIKKRWHWEKLQAKLFKLKVDTLKISQYQSIGSLAINQVKNILITYIAAKSVIDGSLTLGGMIAVQYIVGMVSNPVELLIKFIQSYQDAKISMERLSDIFVADEEENREVQRIDTLPEDKTIRIEDLTFTYHGAGNRPIFKNLNITFQAGKTTAIVGASGSGKTTLLKLLLRHYNPDSGGIYIGDTNLQHITHKVWRNDCGYVLQDSHVFADTIEQNITLSDEDFPDKSRLDHALAISNLQEFVQAQLFGVFTKIGVNGKEISQGQKQRLMIARAIYKQPAYIFLDEATNSLDANNESEIIDKLDKFFRNRTVVIVAHRLSTVRNADNIIVLDKGEVVESGTHHELTGLRGKYYNLVKNQLELGT